MVKRLKQLVPRQITLLLNEINMAFILCLLLLAVPSFTRTYSVSKFFSGIDFCFWSQAPLSNHLIESKLALSLQIENVIFLMLLFAHVTYKVPSVLVKKLSLVVFVIHFLFGLIDLNYLWVQDQNFYLWIVQIPIIGGIIALGYNYTSFICLVSTSVLILSNCFIGFYNACGFPILVHYFVLLIICAMQITRQRKRPT